MLAKKLDCRYGHYRFIWDDFVVLRYRWDGCIPYCMRGQNVLEDRLSAFAQFGDEIERFITIACLRDQISVLSPVAQECHSQSSSGFS